MAEVITLVASDIPADRVEPLEAAYRDLVERGLGPALEDTFLIKAEGSRLAILSLWRRRADRDARLASGEEPPARRLIRTHGGDPQVTIWEVVIRGSEFASSEG